MKIHKFKNSIFLKVLSIFLIFSFLPTSILSPVSVRADKTDGHDNYRIVSYWEQSGSLSVTMEAESNKMGNSAEEKDIKTKTEGGNLLNWAETFSVQTSTGPTYGKVDDTGDTGFGQTMDYYGLIYSFPSYDRPSSGTYSNYNIDMERASKISSTLGANANALFDTVKGLIDYKNSGKAGNAISDSITISRQLMATTTNNAQPILNTGYSIYYCGTDKYSTWMKNENRGTYAINTSGNPIKGDEGGPIAIDKDGNLMAYILEPGKTEPEAGDTGFIWAMPKGYLDPTSGDALTSTTNYWGVYNPNSADGKGDATWITMYTLTEFANAKAMYMNYTSDSHAEGDANFIESLIYGMLFKLYANILNILGLQTIPDLIYNGGTRGGNAYEAGMMNASWWSVVLKYHLIFQIVAWMMIIIAVAKTLIQINFSTVNPALRMTLMESLQKFVMVGFALALCIPLIRLLAAFNNSIVAIFQTQAQGDMDNISGMGLAGIVILFGYMGITFTLNCIYIMRAIMIAILTASAPLFIVSMAFSGPRQKGLFDNWLKEISANIFMQAVHAFAFAFLFDVMDTSKLLTKLVIYFSLLPIVDSFRQLIFGNAGGFAVSQGKAAAQTTGAFIKEKTLGAAAGATNMAAGSIAKKFGANNLNLDDNINTNKDIGSSEGSSGGSRSSGGGLVGKGAAVGNLSLAGKALKENAATGKKGFVQRGAGHALSGGAKALNYLNTKGGIMGNAVTQANLGNVGESMKASATEGDGVTDMMGTVSEDVNAFKQHRTDNAIKKAEDSQNDLKEASDKVRADGLGEQKASFDSAYRNLQRAQATGNEKQIQEAKAAFNAEKKAMSSSESGKNYVKAVQANAKASSRYDKALKKAGRVPISSYIDGKGNETITTNAEIFGARYEDGTMEIKSEYQGQVNTGICRDDDGNFYQKFDKDLGNGKTETYFKDVHGVEKSEAQMAGKNLKMVAKIDGQAQGKGSQITYSGGVQSTKDMFNAQVKAAKTEDTANTQASKTQKSLDSLNKNIKDVNSSIANLKDSVENNR